MSWKWLWLAPLCAMLAGTRVVVPALRPPIPEAADAGCECERARSSYLRAYGYIRENREKARALLDQAASALFSCRGEIAGPLAARIKEQRRILEQETGP